MIYDSHGVEAVTVTWEEMWWLRVECKLCVPSNVSSCSATLAATLVCVATANRLFAVCLYRTCIYKVWSGVCVGQQRHVKWVINKVTLLPTSFILPSPSLSLLPFPVDETRVKLRDDDNDYINANFVKVELATPHTFSYLLFEMFLTSCNEHFIWV